jgi:hypothetical protein
MKQALLNFLYNVDRALASLFGAPRQETISSEIGRHDQQPVVEEAADVLDAIEPGHVEAAVKKADALNKADQE